MYILQPLMDKPTHIGNLVMQLSQTPKWTQFAI